MTSGCPDLIKVAHKSCHASAWAGGSAEPVSFVVFVKLITSSDFSLNAAVAVCRDATCT